MKDLNFVLETINSLQERIKKDSLITNVSIESIENLTKECVTVLERELENKKKFELAVRRVCKDAEIMALGETGDFTKVSIDNVNEVIRLFNQK